MAVFFWEKCTYPLKMALLAALLYRQMIKSPSINGREDLKVSLCALMYACMYVCMCAFNTSRGLINGRQDFKVSLCALMYACMYVCVCACNTSHGTPRRGDLKMSLCACMYVCMCACMLDSHVSMAEWICRCHYVHSCMHVCVHVSLIHMQELVTYKHTAMCMHTYHTDIYSKTHTLIHAYTHRMYSV